jgi:hypothetical protein
MSKKIIRDDIPLGYTRDERGNELSLRYKDGRWRKQTYDALNNKLTYEDYRGDWRKYTRDAMGNELSFEDNLGFWRKVAYNEYGDELSFENQNGRWLKLAVSGGYTLRFSNGIYWAGCRKFTRNEALAHWSGRLNHWVEIDEECAECFIEAINNHKPDDLQVKD